MKKCKILVCVLLFCLGISLISNYTLLQKDAIMNNSSEDSRMNKSYSSSYVPHDAIWIQSNEEFISQADLEGWAGNGSEANPFVITGYSFNQVTQPLRIWNTNLHWIFSDNIVDGISGAQCGTWIQDVSNGAIVDNEFLNRHSGLYLKNLENFIISGNSIHDNYGYGLEIPGEITNCNISDNTITECLEGGIRIINRITNCSIIDNTISQCNAFGLLVTGGVHDSSLMGNIVEEINGFGIFVAMAANSQIALNKIYNSSDDGLTISGLNQCVVDENYIEDINGIGMILKNSVSSEIANNQINNCEENGIEVESGQNSTIMWNIIQDCLGYALEFDINTEFFDVRYNAFVSDLIDCQLHDEGISNIVSQNYYSDWTSPDDDADGYVDEPYDIDGLAENQDLFPLVEAGIVPELPFTTTETTANSATTNNTQNNPDIVMQLALAGGSVAVLLIFAGIIVLKRR